MTTLSSLLSQTYSGFSGFSGSGVSGWSGRSGYSGFSGISGYSGYSGYSGRSGFSGAEGRMNIQNELVSTLLYPVMTKSISNNLPEFYVTQQSLLYNANTGHLYIKDTLGIGTSNVSNSLLRFEIAGNTGQLLSVVDSLTGVLFSVNDVSGIPNFEVYDNSIIKINEFGGSVQVGSNAINSNVQVALTGNLVISGALNATTKSFNIPHPTKEGKQLIYGSLEGPEHGVYIRGRITSEVVEMPDYWTKLVDQNTITVNLTPIGNYQELFVEKVEDNKIYIKNKIEEPIDCFYVIFAERADVDKLEVE